MLIACTRTLVTLFWLATSAYALLCAIPFSSHQFIEPGLLPAVTAFAAGHQWISLAALAVTSAALSPWLLTKHRGVIALIAFWAAAVVLSFVTSGIGGLGPSSVALAVSLGALVPPVWLALLDLRAERRAAASVDASAPAEFAACIGAALLVTATHGAVSMRAAAGGPSASWSAELAQRLVLHLVVFGAIFAAICVIRGVSRFTLHPATVEAAFARLALASLFAAVIHRVVLAPLSFAGGRAAAVAAAMGCALAIVVGPRGTTAPGGLASALAGLSPRWAVQSAARAAIWLALAMGVIAGAQLAIADFDWHFAIGKLLALSSWLIALATALRLAPYFAAHASWRSPMATVGTFAGCVMVLGIHLSIERGLAAEAASPASAAGSRTDVSTRLIQDALAPAPLADDALFEYLQRHTNIPHRVQVSPVSVDFAPLANGSPERPHIFLFVVDSLRRDYLSPYNEGVRFTPAIERFAAESTVFHRAFSRYGATGLSVPSIWVGGFVLHKQYVTPFAPMNALAKLLERLGYTQWLSVDNIVDTIVPPATNRDPLDVGIPVKDYRLCTTLREVRARLDRLTESGPPAFVYSLPQDIHVSAITREGSRPVDDGPYEGFNGAYASRVRRLDACFGGFIDDLKARGLYDQSVVILTADHGDSLGEEGRMGHAYTIFPEIIQVPLLVHLPEQLRAQFTAEAGAAAFTSDLTPSLYALLGHTPTQPSTIFGRPLFRRASDPPIRRDGVEVVASSYGSVYGALLNDARRLYILDAVSLHEHAYELDGTAAGRKIAVRPGDREAGQRAIRKTIDAIASFYRYSAR